MDRNSFFTVELIISHFLRTQQNCYYLPFNQLKMKLKIKLASLLLLIISTIAFSCKKDKDDNANTTKTKTELITKGSWKRTALISDPAYDWNANGVFDTNNLNTMFPCEKDNFETYQTNGMVVTNEGATKCDASDPQTWSVTWRFGDNETKLIWDGNDVYTLLELTETTLKFQSTFTENGVTYTQVETYGQ